MYALVVVVLDGKKHVLLLSLPSANEIETLMSPDDYYDMVLERQIFLNVFYKFGLGKNAIAIDQYEVQDQKLLNYLVETGIYRVYEGEFYEL